MKKLTLVLLVITLGCNKEEIHCNHKQQFCMYVSNINPIQIWLAGEKSFNQRNEKNFPVRKSCYNQPWPCGKDMRWQLKEITEGLDYYLNTLDENGNILASIPFVKNDIIIDPAITPGLEFTNKDFASDVLGWNQYDDPTLTGGADWTWASSTPDNGLSIIRGAVGSFNYSKILGGIRPNNSAYADRGWPPGTYQITVRAANNRTATTYSTLSVYELDDTGNIIGSALDANSTTYLATNPQSATYYNGVLNFTLTNYVKQLGFQFTDGGVIRMNVSYIYMTVAPTTEHIYLKSFYDLTINTTAYCESMVSFEVRRTGDNMLMGFTDPVHVSDNHLSLLQFKYRSIKEFNDVYFDETSDYFELWVEGFLARENNIKEVTTVELVNDEIVQTASAIGKQRKMILGELPDYMHTKIEESMGLPDLKVIGDDNEDVNMIADSPYNLGDRPDNVAMTNSNTLLRRKNYLKRDVI